MSISSQRLTYVVRYKLDQKDDRVFITCSFSGNATVPHLQDANQHDLPCYQVYCKVQKATLPCISPCVCSSSIPSNTEGKLTTTQSFF
jgi:hypothetical protein